MKGKVGFFLFLLWALPAFGRSRPWILKGRGGWMSFTSFSRYPSESATQRQDLLLLAGLGEKLDLFVGPVYSFGAGQPSGQWN